MSEQVTVIKDGQQYVGTLERSFLYNVFTYMFAALAITGVMAYWFGTNIAMSEILFNLETGFTGLGYVVMFAPFAFVLVMSFGWQRLSSMALLLMFVAYSVLMGMSLSFIFYSFTEASIYSTFGITALTFGAMALLGYTTKTDLTKLGNLLYMALIGIIIAGIVNWFIGSSLLDFAISAIGVLVFTGLTAYDVQKLKRIGAGIEYGSETSNKLAIIGALNLYLDFINLFLLLLRFFGDRR